MLAVAGRKDILARMLRNLKTIYLERRDAPRALAAADRIIELEPGAEDAAVVQRSMVELQQIAARLN